MPSEATDQGLHMQAASATRLATLDARVYEGSGPEQSVPQWDELKIWDPGD